jgi:hypothetical protein
MPEAFTLWSRIDMPALPQIILNLDMQAGEAAAPPAADGIFGQLLLLDVGRGLAPILLAPWVWRIASLCF